jgi:hypothetical protein
MSIEFGIASIEGLACQSLLKPSGSQLRDFSVFELKCQPVSLEKSINVPLEFCATSFNVIRQVIVLEERIICVGLGNRNSHCGAVGQAVASLFCSALCCGRILTQKNDLVFIFPPRQGLSDCDTKRLRLDERWSGCVLLDFLLCTLATVYRKRSVHWPNQTAIQNPVFRSSVMSAFRSCLAQGSTVYGDLTGCWYLPGIDGLDCRHHYSRSGRAWRA